MFKGKFEAFQQVKANLVVGKVGSAVCTSVVLSRARVIGLLCTAMDAVGNFNGSSRGGLVATAKHVGVRDAHRSTGHHSLRFSNKLSTYWAFGTTVAKRFFDTAQMKLLPADIQTHNLVRALGQCIEANGTVTS